MKIGLKELLKKFENGKMKIIMEDRYGLGYRIYSIINHAEVKDCINEADGDLWDVVIPGYKDKLKKKEYDTNDILGIFVLNNGNSKIFMRVDEKGYEKKRACDDINKFISEYLYWNDDVSGEWFKWEEIRGRL